MFRKITLCLGLVLALVPGLFAGMQADKDWTIIFYMLADNNLESDALDDLEELAASGVDAKANVLVMIDRAEGYDDRSISGLGEFTDAKYLELSKGKWLEKKKLGETNMADPKTLDTWLTWSLGQYKAKHLALVFWDHGGGWVGYGGDDSAPDQPLIGVSQLASSIKKALAASSYKKVDLLGFDACLMGNYETALALSPVADWYLASSELEPGHGWDHHAWKVLLSGADAPALGKALADGFVAQSKASDDFTEVTLSLVDMQKIPALETSLASFVAKISKTSMPAAEIGRVQGKVQGFARDPNPDEDPQLVDLGSLVTGIAALDKGLANEAAAVNKALAAAVSYRIAGDARKKSTGLSIYFPNRKKLYDENYRTMPSTGWKNFLDLYFKANASASGTTSGQAAQGQSAPPAAGNKKSFDFVDDPQYLTMETDDQGGMTLKGRMNKGYGSRIVDSLFAFGYLDGTDTVYIGDAPANIEKDDVEGYWDGTILVLRQGKTEGYAYLSLESSDDETSEYSIPFSYYSKGAGKGDPESVSLSVVVDQEGKVLSRTFYRADDDVWSELKPKKGSALVPIVEVWAKDAEEGEWQTTMDGYFDPLKEIELDFGPFGELSENPWLELTVWDAQDLEATVVYDGSD